MRYSDDLVEEVRSRNDIVDVISGYVKLTRRGSNYFGLCPFHSEKSPSFSVTPSKQMYYCFGCGAGGNVFTFLMEYENCSFPEALKTLAGRAGISLPEQEYSEEERRRADAKSRILEMNKLAAKYYYYLLRTSQGRTAYEYLKKRGLDDDTIKKFGLGYSSKYSDGLYRYLRKQGFSDGQLRESGLVTMDEKHGVYDKFWNRVMFPIMDAGSRVIGFGGRVMGDGKPKYLNSPETEAFDKSRNLYGLHLARLSRKGHFILCEGYMDVIALHQAGFSEAVASLGTALTARQALLVKRYVSKVLLCYDSDEAGRKAALRAIPILKEAGISARVIDMRPWKDPDEFIKNEGAEAFQERIDGAQNSFLYELWTLEDSYDLADPEGKTAFQNACAMRLLQFEEELERENYMQAVSERYQIPYESLKRRVQELGNQGYVPKEAQEAGKKAERERTAREREDGMRNSQRLLLTWLVEIPGLYGQVRSYLSWKDFTEPMCRECARQLFEQLEEGQANPARIVSSFESQEEQKEAAALFNKSPGELPSKEALEKAVLETLLKVLGSSLDLRAKEADTSDIGAFQEIIRARQELQKLEKLHISID